MSKIIINPNECAHQSKEILVKKGSAYVPKCKHPRNERYALCTNSRDFPEECPLNNGMTIKEHLDAVLALGKKLPSLGSKTVNIPELSPQFFWCSYCKAYIVINSQEDANTHVIMIHGITGLNIPPCKLG